MPDTTAPQHMPDPIPHSIGQMGAPLAPLARVALESAPRQHSLPEHALASSLPLPPPWPPLERHTGGMAPASSEGRAVDGTDGTDDLGPFDGADMENMFAPRDPNDRTTRPIFTPEQWVSDPDFWESKTHIALTGRHPVPRPKTVALEPPQRFRPVPRWRSLLILVVVCLLIVFAVAGAVELGRLGMQVIGPTHHATPPVPTHTLVVPTTTPHHKK